MSSRNFTLFEDDFPGGRSYSPTATSNAGHSWIITETAAAGTPVYGSVDSTDENAWGELSIAFDSQAEAQNLCLDFGDTLAFDIDRITEAEFRIKMCQAALDATTMLAFGLIGDRNDAIDTIAQAMIFRVIGADDTTNVVVESDDGTNENNDIATGTTLINAYKDFKINLATGTNDVRFFIDDQPIAAATTFNMSSYTGKLQPFVQIQKTSDANVDAVTVDRITVRGRRPL